MKSNCLEAVEERQTITNPLYSRDKMQSREQPSTRGKQEKALPLGKQVFWEEPEGTKEFFLKMEQSFERGVQKVQIKKKK